VTECYSIWTCTDFKPGAARNTVSYLLHLYLPVSKVLGMFLSCNGSLHTAICSFVLPVSKEINGFHRVYTNLVHHITYGNTCMFHSQWAGY
jgi:hypothetical protein